MVARGLVTSGVAGDDSFVVKAWNDVRNLTVRHCVAWSDVATAFGVSLEVFSSVSDTTFKDCTAIHSMASGAYGGILTVHIGTGTNGSVTNTTFENIVLEDAPVRGCDLMLLKIDPPRPSATISRIEFRNISALHSAAIAPARLSPGNDSTCAGLIEGVLFDNVWVNSKPLGATDIVNENTARARNITNERILSDCSRSTNAVSGQSHVHHRYQRDVTGPVAHVTNEVEIFRSGEGSMCFRVPMVVALPWGTLLAFAEAREWIGDGCYPHVRVSISYIIYL